MREQGHTDCSTQLITRTALQWPGNHRLQAFANPDSGAKFCKIRLNDDNVVTTPASQHVLPTQHFLHTGSDLDQGIVTGFMPKMII